MANPQKRIIIIGSGWAGFYLADTLDTKKYDIIVISPDRTSAYTPLLASAACGLFNFYLAEEPVRSKGRHISYIKAWVDDINFEKKLVNCHPAFDDETAEQKFSMDYDKLVICPGCGPNTFGTPGVLENALMVKNVKDAMAIRAKLFDVLEKASLPGVSEERQRELLHVAIVGGGPTGVEITAELYDLKKDLVQLYPNVADKLTITIHDVAPNILSAYDKKLYEYAHDSLLRRKVEILCTSHITKVEPDALYTKELGRIPYGMLVWATGNKHVPLVDTLDARKSTHGLKRLITDSRLRLYRAPTSPHSSTESLPSETDSKIFDGVYALGDVADIASCSLPTTAEVAVQKAKYLSKVLNAEDETTPFKYNQKALVSYIGGHDGVIGGRDWTGRSAWLAWRSGSLMWTRSIRGKVMILLTWMINAIVGKEIARI